MKKKEGAVIFFYFKLNDRKSMVVQIMLILEK